MTRRTVLAGLAAASAAQAQRQVEWKPRLGILGPFTEANVRFASEEGFTNMILGATRKSTMDANVVTDAQIDNVKQTLAKYRMNVSAFQASQNHIDPDPAKRKADNDYFVKLIENAGKLGIPYIGTSSGKDANKSLDAQVDDIVKTYTERYFPPARRTRSASCGNRIRAAPTSPLARRVSMRCSKPSTIHLTSDCSTIRRTWCGSSWTPSRLRAIMWTRSTTSISRTRKSVGMSCARSALRLPVKRSGTCIVCLA